MDGFIYIYTVLEGKIKQIFSSKKDIPSIKIIKINLDVGSELLTGTVGYFKIQLCLDFLEGHLIRIIKRFPLQNPSKPGFSIWISYVQIYLFIFCIINDRQMQQVWVDLANNLDSSTAQLDSINSSLMTSISLDRFPHRTIMRKVYHIVASLEF